MKITLGEISGVLKAQLVGNSEKIITNISFDSRNCTSETLFAALKGQNRDGHEFIPQVVSCGGAVLCSKDPGITADAIITQDVGKALSDIAKWYKENKCNIEKTVAITGSVGKTTTKDMTSCVMNTKFTTHKTQGNFNNALGVPMTLFGIESQHNALVCEMGMSGLGEIQELSQLVCPDIAVITNIGTSHIEKLGSRENICKAKLEIISGMKKGSTLIFNGDEPMLRQAAQTLDEYKIIFAGMGKDNDIYPENIHSKDTTCFAVNYGGKSYQTEISVAGEHNVVDALFGFAVGVVCGIQPKDAAKGLGDYKSSGMRQNIIEKDGVRIIADCYNASRESMCASIKVLCSQSNQSPRKIAVLGEMLELGEKSQQYHYDVGVCISEQKPDMLLTLAGAKGINQGAVENGYPAEKSLHFETKQQLCDAVINIVKKGDTVLFKASRGVKLEEIINKLGFEI